MKIRFQKCRSEARIPTHGSVFSAGYDLYSCEDAEIAPHQTRLIPTGLILEIPEGYFGGIFARSGLASKRNLRPANCVGVIDSDYRGEVMVALHNDSEETRSIEKDERIAQLIVLKHEELEFEESGELNDTERAAGGFGSSGRK